MKKSLAAVAAASIVTVAGITLSGPASATTTPIRAKTVAKHSTTTDCWTIIGRSVYNLTPMVRQHPGGAEAIAALCGRNGTSDFNSRHRYDSSAKSWLATFRIGAVAR